MLNYLINAGLIFLFIIVSVLILLYTFQNKLLYIPVIAGVPKSPSQNPVGMQNPSDRKIPYENVQVGTLDRQILKGWLCKQPNSQNVPTVIYYHENAGSYIGTRVYFLEYYYNVAKVNVLLIAYRGYSDSTGEPTEEGLQLDGESILNYVFHRPDLNQNQIFVHGRSLGGAVAIYVMTQKLSQRVAGVILENTFASISEMVDVIFPKLRWFKQLVQRNYWPSSSRIGQITQPILFIYCKNKKYNIWHLAMKDEIVPPNQMAELESKAIKAKFIKKFVIEDGMHNNNWSLDVDGYFGAIKEFMDSVGVK